MSLSKVPILIPTQKATPYFFSHFLLAFQSEQKMRKKVGSGFLGWNGNWDFGQTHLRSSFSFFF